MFLQGGYVPREERTHDALVILRNPNLSSDPRKPEGRGHEDEDGDDRKEHHFGAALMLAWRGWLDVAWKFECEMLMRQRYLVARRLSG